MIIGIVNEIKCADLFAKLLTLDNDLLIPRFVYDELLDKNSKHVCKQLIDNDDMEICLLNTIEEVEDFQKSYPYLGKGECDSILQFGKLKNNGKIVHCILDDKRARSVADSLDIQYMGLLGLLKLLKGQGIITTPEYEHIVSTLKKSKFRMPRDVI